MYNIYYYIHLNKKKSFASKITINIYPKLMQVISDHVVDYLNGRLTNGNSH